MWTRVKNITINMSQVCFVKVLPNYQDPEEIEIHFNNNYKLGLVEATELSIEEVRDVAAYLEKMELYCVC